MAATVRLTVLTGPHKSQRFCFRGPMRCTVGRGADCAIRLAGHVRDFSLSRHHCELALEPPCIRIQDLGSLNGTYRNGKKLAADEMKLTEATAALARKLSVAEEVEDGDVITTGETSFRVDLVDCCLGPMPAGADRPVWPEGATAKTDCTEKC